MRYTISMEKALKTAPEEIWDILEDTYKLFDFEKVKYDFDNGIHRLAMRLRSAGHIHCNIQLSIGDSDKNEVKYYSKRLVAAAVDGFLNNPDQ